MAGAGKALAALSIMALVLMIVGCGNDDSSTDESSGRAAQEKTTTQSQDDGQDRGSSSEAEGSKEREGKPDSGNGGGREEKPGSRGAENFSSRGGDTSIQSLGREASAAERDAASRVLETYFQAREDGDQKTACANLAPLGIGQLENLSQAIPEVEGKGCVAIFIAIDERTSPSVRANPMAAPVGSLRLGDGRAFALFRGTGGVDYAIRMTKEDDGWKVAALVPYAIS